MMKDKPTTKPSALGEWALWPLAGLFLSVLALMAMGSARYLFDWTESQWILSSVAVAVFSLTWGSWAALLWTRNRILRALMIAVVLIPGVLLIVVGGWAFINMPENRWIWRWGWLIVAGHGLGAVALAAMLSVRRMATSAQPLKVRPRQLAIGWTLYPVLVVVGSVAIVATTFALMPDVFCGGETTTQTLARWVVPSQALVLLTTALPGLAAYICHQVTSVGRRSR